MSRLPFRYCCHVCGHPNDLKLEVPDAPDVDRQQIKCKECGEVTHILVTACPNCNEAFRYFLSDLDFPTEIRNLASAYVELIGGIRSSLKNHVKHFKVPLPKKWTVNLQCDCGHAYEAEIDLPQLE